MSDIKRVADVKPFQKPQDSIFSMLFTRKVSRVITFYLIKLDSRVTPNKVSILSFLIAVLACVFFFYEEYWWRFFGAVLIQLSFAFDCSDGEVSRIKNLSSKFGAWLDSVLDRFKEILMLGSMTLYWYMYEWTDPRVLVIGFLAITGLLLVAYLREAKKSSWPSTRTSEVFISKNTYIGTVDVIVYIVTAAVILNIEIIALAFFLVVSIPMVLKQLLSAYRLGSKE